MVKSMYVAMFATAMVLLTGAAQATPITANLTGTISTISADIAPDVAGLIAIGDPGALSITYDSDLVTGISPSGPWNVFNDAIVSINASLNGGAIEVHYDPSAGSSLNITWVSETNQGSFNPVDFDLDGTSGAITGPVFPTSDPIFLTNWNPLQFVVFFGPVADDDVYPLTPAFDYVRIDWRAEGRLADGSNFGQQSGIYLSFDSVEFVSPNNGGDLPEPGTLAALLAGLTMLCLRRCR